MEFVNLNYKVVLGGHIWAVGTGQNAGTAITEEELAEILARLEDKPADEEGYRWLLADGTLEWEKEALPPAEDEIPAEDALAIVTGEVPT